MQLTDLDIIIEKALRDKKIVEVTYVRKEDGITTCRLMEPYDVNSRRGKINNKIMFWGWCLTHNTIEQKIPENIISVQITSSEFIPRTFKTIPNYRLPRDW